MRRDLNRDPLVKILRIVVQRVGIINGDEFGMRREVLICGHIVRIKQDIYGETNAYRRRCRKCGDLRLRANAL
jgi:hypothetical protein